MEDLKKNTNSCVNGNLISDWKRINSMVVGLFTLLILAGVPVIFRDYYFDILTFKYHFYCAVVILMVLVLLIVAIIFINIDNRNYEGKNRAAIINGINIRSLSAADWAMLAFFMAVVISTFQSDYFYESFWGNEGRYCGLFLIILYTVSFFIITKCLRFKQWYLDVFLAAGMIVCIIGILHYFQIDPIGFKTDLTDKDYHNFTSTIGNINTYTSYIAIVTGMSSILFVNEKKIYRKIWYLICMVVSLFSLITGISDNAYLALMALYGLLPLYLFSNLKGFKQYVLMLAILISEFQLIDFVMQKFPKHVMEISGLFNIVSGYSKLIYVVLILWGMTAILYVLDYVWGKGRMDRGESNIGRLIWLAIIVIVAALMVFVLYDVNVKGNINRYGSLSGYLYFDDDWGTHRGYIWRIGLESYQRFPLIHKIFGYGPDTFGIITRYNYYDEMVKLYGEKFESAHNEYLQYFITIGVVGLLSYLSLLIVSIWKMMKEMKREPSVVAIVFAVICYGAQAFVNISVPIVAPVMLTLLMVGLSMIRERPLPFPEDTVAGD
ncbi:O-antigen ligase family protein [Enterocloster citroniae]|uniref:O-antigen ligase family protein n=1 Tax=Enterocloster citroniae TaxID=358743 RepID=UPI0008EF780C|nr:O-antigen ligase family protein [Enterocloster citroniae]SFS23114.1 O-antigen ligase [Enterocloster citroniae]